MPSAETPDEPDLESRLDAEKLDVLRVWGAGLGGDGRDEVRAAGKAIVLLVEEIDRLYVQLWHARDQAAVPDEPAADVEVGESFERSLAARLRLAVRRASRRDAPHGA